MNQLRKSSAFAMKKNWRFHERAAIRTGSFMLRWLQQTITLPFCGTYSGWITR